jgi:hypothetical protein
MQRTFPVLGIIIILACGGSPTDPTSEPLKGTAYFTIDQASCVYAGTRAVTFYIATVEVGTQSLARGATSVGYLTKATSEYTTSGNPVVQARIGAAGSALWTYRTNINVPTNGSVTHTFIC